ncbi:IMP dehydrogenase [Streptomyces celluloflavus]|uniref:IMP dehydrogenase n=1 Tax=Streptomyces celluloflavus TaxID=58344 RepID=A0ABW7RDN4_9ACTN|nr:IMP dehydrogenase [Streptomyces celluloflavus]
MGGRPVTRCGGRRPGPGAGRGAAGRCRRRGRGVGCGWGRLRGRRYFARFDESPSRKVRVDGQYYKEYWGEGSRRARNAARYGQSDGIAFEEGVDGFVPYAGSLYDNVELTRSKLTATMISCGATTLQRFHEEAVMVQVSERSYEQNTAEVRLRERSVDSGE